MHRRGTFDQLGFFFADAVGHCQQALKLALEHVRTRTAFGGTLWQDIPSQQPQALDHVCGQRYDQLLHPVQLLPGSRLAALYPGRAEAAINSIHHQAVKDLGRGMVVEARAPDGQVEAIRWDGPSHVFGMQWHPEFLALRQLHDQQLDGGPILQDFLAAARARAHAA